jgi:SAM-dependent methyltransferase
MTGSGQPPAAIDWGAGRDETTAAQLAPAAAVVVQRASLRPGERVLDLGCGTGNAALLAVRAGSAVTGVDPAARLLEVARNRAAGAATLRLQRQLCQHVRPARPAQHRITQLEQRIPAPAQAPVHLLAEPGQPPRCQAIPAAPVRASVAVDVSVTPRHAILKATATAFGLQVLWKGPEDDDAVAVCYQREQPYNSGGTRRTGQQRLNGKLRARL